MGGYLPVYALNIQAVHIVGSPYALPETTACPDYEDGSLGLVDIIYDLGSTIRPDIHLGRHNTLVHQVLVGMGPVSEPKISFYLMLFTLSLRQRIPRSG